MHPVNGNGRWTVFKQWHFSGGLPLEAHKHVSEITQAKIPAELIYPLLQRSDCYAKPIVAVGDIVCKGQVIATPDSPLATPMHSASSGTIKAITPYPIAHPSGLSDYCIIIATDGLDKALPAEPCTNFLYQTPDLLRTKIDQAGIVGLGGAAFPTAQKLHSVQPVHTLIINAAECEPYISCDESLIQAHAQQIISGALIIQHILQTQHCIIALEDNMSLAHQRLLAATENTSIQLSSVPAIYPTGGEKQLIQVLTGLKIPANSLPATHGIICHNVGTAYAVYQAIALGIPLTERIVTVTGKGINNAQNIRAKIGTPIKDLITQCGGYAPNIQRLIMGGPMMGIALSTDDIALTKATNCILAMTAEESPASPASLPCIRCGDCATVCPAALQPQQLYWYSRSNQLDKCLDYHLFDCIECGCCDIVCPSHIPLVQMFRAAKGEHSMKEKQAAQASKAKIRYQNRQQRFAREEQEKLAQAEKRKATIEKMKIAALKRKNQ